MDVRDGDVRKFDHLLLRFYGLGLIVWYLNRDSRESSQSEPVSRPSGVVMLGARRGGFFFEMK